MSHASLHIWHNRFQEGCARVAMRTRTARARPPLAATSWITVSDWTVMQVSPAKSNSLSFFQSIFFDKRPLHAREQFSLLNHGVIGRTAAVVLKQNLAKQLQQRNSRKSCIYVSLTHGCRIIKYEDLKLRKWKRACLASCLLLLLHESLLG
jgi:hypothetical protein